DSSGCKPDFQGDFTGQSAGLRALHFDVKLVSISKQSRDFKLKGLLRFFAASQKLAIEPYFCSSFHAGEGQPHTLIFIDATRIAEMSTKAHAAGKGFQTSLAPATRHGHFGGSRRTGGE